MLLEPSANFGAVEEEVPQGEKNLQSFVRYLLPFKGLFLQIFIGIGISSLIQLIFPFLTQAMVDVGIGQRNINIITIILVAQLMLFVTQLSIGYLRSWILLHVNSRINISLISDFLIKLSNMPLHFFDTKKTGDIMQRIGDHARIKSFLMGNSMNIYSHYPTL